MASVTPANGTSSPARRGHGTGRSEACWNRLYAVDRSGASSAATTSSIWCRSANTCRCAVSAGRRIAPGATDFSPDQARAPSRPGLPPIRPLICYEVIFPGVVRDRHPARLAAQRDERRLVRELGGPHQHFAFARLRAVEQGLPLVRAANTGISGVFDGYGRVTAYLGLGERGVVDADLPVALPITPYGRFGDTVLVLLLMSFSLVTTIARQTR